MTTITLLLLILVRGSETAAQERHWLSYEPATVELEGRFRIIWRYGPPNFGENPKTDAKLEVPILVLSKPLNVRGNPEYFPFNVDVTDVRRIQLLLFNIQTPYERLIGKKLIVRGTLLHAHMGHHFTKVMMEVHSINAVRTLPRPATKPSPQKD